MHRLTEWLDPRHLRTNAYEGLLGDGALILKFLLRISPEESKRRKR